MSRARAGAHAGRIVLAGFWCLNLMATATATAMATAMAATAAAPAVESASRFRLTEWPVGAPSPAFHLRDVEHRRRASEDFRGRVAVVYFGFTHCPDVCPSEMVKLSLAARRLGPRASRLAVIFVTLDPDRDTPDILRAYVRAFDDRFVGLTGSSAEINRAAASFSVAFSRVPTGRDYTIEHSTGVYVLDKSGRLRLIGTPETSVDDWVHDLEILVDE